MNIIDLVFPKKCFGCDKVGKYFCEICNKNLLESKQICIECMRPSVDGKTHFGCQKRYSLDGFVSVYKYQGAIKKSLIYLKYRFAFDVAEDLANLVLRHIEKVTFLFPIDAMIMPIPLYVSRENWRGFNQSAIVAKKIAKQMKWKYDDSILIRLTEHIPQAKLHKAERLKNVKDIYKVLQSERIFGKNIILIDDVVTTGATFREVGKLLKSRGAKTVWGIAVAH